MKRAIIINLLILILLNLQPKEIKVEVKEVIKEETISSRSLEEPRQQITAESEKKQSKPIKISQEGIELIKKLEGFRDKAYKLEGEKCYTIGYGTHNSNIYEGQVITEQQAEELLMQEVNKVTKQVLEYCEYLDLTQNELSALVCFTYNCGFENLKKLTGYRSRDKEEISQKILNYTKSGSEVYRDGLKKRRQAEQELFKKS